MKKIYELRWLVASAVILGASAAVSFKIITFIIRLCIG